MSLIEQVLADIKSDRKKKVIIDTDAYNEVDDQYSIAYSIAASDKFDVLSINAAPFKWNGNSYNYEDGMERSYEEIIRVLEAAGLTDIPVYMGSNFEMTDNGGAPVYSPAARNIIDAALASDEIIYIFGLGAITNVASALLMRPDIKDKIALIWLAGTIFDGINVDEYNLKQDYRAGQVVFDSGMPLILCPAWDVTKVLECKMPEMAELQGNRIGDYLFGIVDRLAREMERLGNKYEDYGRIIWDIAAPAVLAVPHCAEYRIAKAPFLCENVITGDRQYGFSEQRHELILMTKLNRDVVFEDAWKRIKSL